jgi:hypothetical protein
MIRNSDLPTRICIKTSTRPATSPIRKYLTSGSGNAAECRRNAAVSGEE